MAVKKYYVVWQGRKPGIYQSWADCQEQIAGFNGAKFKSFTSITSARQALESGRDVMSVAANVKNSRIITPSLSVDAACSGNPGIMEYQGVNTETKETVFHKKFDLGTNNIGEFLALVHGLAFLKKHNSNLPIYSDSQIAIGWINKKRCKTKLENNSKTAGLFNTIDRAERWLFDNSYQNQILKWETKKWGEIPADFGRK